MQRHYLHLSAHVCDHCGGPVVSGTLAVRENEISKETDVREIGAICLCCGQRPGKAGNAGLIRKFPPVEWQPAKTLNPVDLKLRAEPAAVTCG